MFLIFTLIRIKELPYVCNWFTSLYQYFIKHVLFLMFEIFFNCKSTCLRTCLRTYVALAITEENWDIRVWFLQGVFLLYWFVDGSLNPEAELVLINHSQTHGSRHPHYSPNEYILKREWVTPCHVHSWTVYSFSVTSCHSVRSYSIWMSIFIQSDVRSLCNILEGRKI